MKKFIVKPKTRPFKTMLYVMIFSLLVVGVTWHLFDGHFWEITQAGVYNSKKLSSVLLARKSLEEENKVLKQKIMRLERLKQIDDEAKVHVQQEIVTLQDEVYQLKKDLEFYEDIVSSTSSSNGINIQGMRAQEIEDRLYRFTLILTNITKNNKDVKVRIGLTVEGMEREALLSLSLDELTGEHQFDQNVSFKHFSRHEGSLYFPVGFKPLRVIVKLYAQGAKKVIADRTFDWLEVSE